MNQELQTEQPEQLFQSQFLEKNKTPRSDKPQAGLIKKKGQKHENSNNKKLEIWKGF